MNNYALRPPRVFKNGASNLDNDAESEANNAFVQSQSGAFNISIHRHRLIIGS